MANVILKDRDGNPVTYEGVKRVRLLTPDNSTQDFIIGDIMEKSIEPDFSNGDMVVTPEEDKYYNKVTVKKPSTLLAENIAKDVEVAGVIGTFGGMGEIIEDMDIVLDLKDGDQPLLAPDGYLVKSALIKKPESLVPENIKKDVDIAGIVGILENGGGSDIKITSGSITGNGMGVNISHNLGVLPDIFIIWTNDILTNVTQIITLIGISSAIKTKTGYEYGYRGVFRKSSSTSNIASSSDCNDGESGLIRQANENTIMVGNMTYPLRSNVNYYWLAFGGLI